MSNNIKNNESNSKSKQSDEVKTPKFTVQTFPKDSFKLFARDDENIDSYIWEKRFYNTLPKLAIPPKSFNFNLSHEALCNFNMPTITFSLKQFPILTDSKMNTNINKDLIEKSINFIFPESDIYNSTQQKFSTDPNFKKDILSIIESRDDIPEAKKKVKTSMYSRSGTQLITPSMNMTNKKLVIPDKPDFNNSQADPKNANINIIADINKTFTTIKNVKEGIAHPTKKGVVAKNVYDVQPFFQFLNHKFSEIMYPNDYDNVADSKKTVILKLNKNEQPEDEKIFSCYTKEKNEEISPVDNMYLKKSLNFDRHFSYKLANSNEIFNSGVLLLDKTTKKAFHASLNKKFMLKKYKKQELNYDKDDENMKFTNKKRNRNLNITPISKSSEVLNMRNQLFKSFKIQMEYVDNSEEVDQKVKELDEKYNENNNDNDGSSNHLFDEPEQDNNDEENVEDLFDQKDNF